MTVKNIHRELGEISATLKEMKEDISEIKKIAPRVRSLEVFRSYVKGGAAVLSATFIAFKSFFNHF